MSCTCSFPKLISKDERWITWRTFPIFTGTLRIHIMRSLTQIFWCENNELYTWDENDCIFATENLKLTAHVRWQENSEILQLKIICMHNLCHDGHRVEWLTFNQDCVKISFAFVFIVTFVTRDFYGKEKIVKHTQIYSLI